MGNCHERTGGGADILDMDGDCNMDGCATVCCDPERLVGTCKDRPSMRAITRIVLSGTVHFNTCITVICLGYLHAQQSGKFALVKSSDPPDFQKFPVICLMICGHEYSEPIKNHREIMIYYLYFFWV